MSESYLQQIQRVIDQAKAAAAARPAPTPPPPAPAPVPFEQFDPPPPLPPVPPVSTYNPFTFVPVPASTTAAGNIETGTDAYRRLQLAEAAARNERLRKAAVEAREKAREIEKQHASLAAATSNIFKRYQKSTAIDVEASSAAKKTNAVGNRSGAPISLMDDDGERHYGDEEGDINDAPMPLAMKTVKPRQIPTKRGSGTSSRSLKTRVLASMHVAPIPGGTRSRWVARNATDREAELKERREQKARLDALRAEQLAAIRKSATTSPTLSSSYRSSSSSTVSTIGRSATSSPMTIDLTTPPASGHKLPKPKTSLSSSNSSTHSKTSATTAASRSTTASASIFSSSSAATAKTSKSSSSLPSKKRARSPSPSSSSSSGYTSEEDDGEVGTSESELGAAATARAALRGAKRQRELHGKESPPKQAKLNGKHTVATATSKSSSAKPATSLSAAASKATLARRTTPTAATNGHSHLAAAASATASTSPNPILPVIPLPPAIANTCALTTPLRQSFVDALLRLCLRAHPDRFDAEQLHPSLPGNALILRCEWKVMEETLKLTHQQKTKEGAQVRLYKEITNRVLQWMRTKKDLVAVSTLLASTTDWNSFLVGSTSASPTTTASTVTHTLSNGQ